MGTLYLVQFPDFSLAEPRSAASSVAFVSADARSSAFGSIGFSCRPHRCDSIPRYPWTCCCGRSRREYSSGLASGDQSCPQAGHIYDLLLVTSPVNFMGSENRHSQATPSKIASSTAKPPYGGPGAPSGAERAAA